VNAAAANAPTGENTNGTTDAAGGASANGANTNTANNGTPQNPSGMNPGGTPCPAGTVPSAGASSSPQ